MPARAVTSSSCGTGRPRQTTLLTPGGGGGATSCPPCANADPVNAKARKVLTIPSPTEVMVSFQASSGCGSFLLAAGRPVTRGLRPPVDRVPDRRPEAGSGCERVQGSTVPRFRDIWQHQTSCLRREGISLVHSCPASGQDFAPPLFPASPLPPPGATVATGRRPDCTGRPRFS